MSDGAPAPQVDLQDPLPEASWLWRRVFTFSVTAAVLYMLWITIDRLAGVALSAPSLGVPALLSLCKWIIGFTAMNVTYYMVAPSAEQIVKMMKTASLLRSGLQIHGSRTEDTPDGQVTTSKTIGTPAAPLIPGAGDTILPPEAPLAGSDEEGPPWAGQKENI
jgi:hypothetical protein